MLFIGKKVKFFHRSPSNGSSAYLTQVGSSRINILVTYSLREKCPYSEFFWSAFSRIWTEYGEIRSISLYSVRMREKTDQTTPNTDSFHSVITLKCHAS